MTFLKDRVLNKLYVCVLWFHVDSGDSLELKPTCYSVNVFVLKLYV